MRERYLVNLNSLNNYQTKFKGEYTNFTNGSRKSFSNSYFYQSNDSAIVTMRNKLNTLYTEIDKGYANIIKWMGDYIKDSSDLEKSLKNGTPSVSDTSTNSTIKKIEGKNNVNVEAATDIVSKLDKNRDVGPSGQTKGMETVIGGVKAIGEWMLGTSIPQELVDKALTCTQVINELTTQREELNQKITDLNSELERYAYDNWNGEKSDQWEEAIKITNEIEKNPAFLQYLLSEDENPSDQEKRLETKGTADAIKTLKLKDYTEEQQKYVMMYVLQMQNKAELAQLDSMITQYKNTRDLIQYEAMAQTGDYQDYVKNFDLEATYKSYQVSDDEMDWDKYNTVIVAMHNQKEAEKKEIENVKNGIDRISEETKKAMDAKGDKFRAAERQEIEEIIKEAKLAEESGDLDKMLAAVNKLNEKAKIFGIEGYEHKWEQVATLEDIPAGEEFANPNSVAAYASEEQLQMYCYLYETQGKEAASKFLHYILDDVNRKQGKANADHWIEEMEKNYAKGGAGGFLGVLWDSTTEGLGDGLSSFFDGMDSAFCTQTTVSAGEYERMYKAQYASENGVGMIYNVNSSVGRMLPSIAVGLMPGGQFMSSVTFGVSAYGEGKNKAARSGASWLTTQLYGLLMGGGETVTEYFLGGIPGLSQGAGNIGKNMIKEGLQEFTQTYYETALNKYLLGEDVDLGEVSEEAFVAFAYGAVTSAYMTGATSIPTVVKCKVNGVEVSMDIESMKEKLNEKGILKGMGIDTTGKSGFEIEVAKANYQNSNNYVAEIKVDDISTITEAQLKEIQHPEMVVFNDGKNRYSYNELHKTLYGESSNVKGAFDTSENVSTQEKAEFEVDTSNLFADATKKVDEVIKNAPKETNSKENQEMQEISDAIDSMPSTPPQKGITSEQKTGSAVKVETKQDTAIKDTKVQEETKSQEQKVAVGQAFQESTKQVKEVLDKTQAMAQEQSKNLEKIVAATTEIVSTLNESSTNNSQSNENTKSYVDTEIEKANYYNSKGNFASVNLESLSDITNEDLNKLNNPQATIFKTADGKTYSYKEVLDFKYRETIFNNKVSELSKTYARLGYSSQNINGFISQVSPQNIDTIINNIKIQEENYNNQKAEIHKQMIEMGYSEEQITQYFSAVNFNNIQQTTELINRMYNEHIANKNKTSLLPNNNHDYYDLEDIKEMLKTDINKAFKILEESGFSSNDIEKYINYLNQGRYDYVAERIFGVQSNILIKNSEYFQYVDGIKFVSDSKERLAKLINYYQESKKSSLYVDGISISNDQMISFYEDLSNLAKSGKGLIITNMTLPDNGDYFFQNYNNNIPYIHLNSNTIARSDYTTLYHEGGHYKGMTRDSKYEIFNPITSIIANTSPTELQEIVEKYRMYQEEYRNNLIERIRNDYSTQMEQELEKRLTKELGEDYKTNPDKASLAETLGNIYRQEILEDYIELYQREEGLAALDDIFEALGFKVGRYGHGREYYNKQNNSNEEIRANLNQIFFSGNFGIMIRFFNEVVIKELREGIEAINGITKTSTSTSTESIDTKNQEQQDNVNIFKNNVQQDKLFMSDNMKLSQYRQEAISYMRYTFQNHPEYGTLDLEKINKIFEKAKEGEFRGISREYREAFKNAYYNYIYYEQKIEQKKIFDQKVEKLKSYMQLVSTPSVWQDMIISSITPENIDTELQKVIQEQNRQLQEFDRLAQYLKEKLKNQGISEPVIEGLIQTAIGDINSNNNINAGIRKLNEYIAQANERDRFIQNNKYLSSDSLFDDNRGYLYLYGVDQGVLHKLYFYEDPVTGERYSEREFQAKDKKKRYILSNEVRERAVKYYFDEEYERLKAVIMKYGFSKLEASMIMSGVDKVGACSYADVANQIFAHYRNNPEGFKRDFGFDMYTTIQGQKTLNSAELLLDMYIFFNDKQNGGALFEHGHIVTFANETGWAHRPVLYSEGQKYLSTSNGMEDYKINNYLKSKNSRLDYSAYGMINNYVQYDRRAYPIPELDIRKCASIVQNGINNGQHYSLGIYANKYSEITMYSLDNSEAVTTNTWKEGGGHALYITGVTKDGFVVSSWGGKWIIPYNALSNGASFEINTIDISEF